MTPSTLLSPLLTYCADLPGFSRHAIEVAETEQRIATVLSALTVQTELLFDANAQLNAMRKDRDALLARIAELEPLAECAAIMAVCGYFSRMRGPDLQVAYKQFGGGCTRRFLRSEDAVRVHRDEGYEMTPLYAGSAPVPTAQRDSLLERVAELERELDGERNRKLDAPARGRTAPARCQMQRSAAGDRRN